MLQLLNELHALPNDPLLRKNHLLASLCRILNAKVGLVGLLRNVGNSWRAGSVAQVEYGWPCPRERAAVMAYHTDAARDPQRFADPMESMLADSEQVVTRRREQVRADATWYGCGNVSDHRRPGRIDDCIYSLHRLPDNWTIGMAVHREWGDRVRFGRRDSDLLHVLNQHLGFLWQRDVAGCQARTLSTRLQQTLALLSRGYSEKQVAQALDVSRNTVHKYVTALYRHYDVGSRAELLARTLGTVDAVPTRSADASDTTGGD